MNETLDQLDRAAIIVDDVSVHIANLDNVYFALTWRPESQTSAQKGSVR
jgi:hypothetical protein